MSTKRNNWLYFFVFALILTLLIVYLITTRKNIHLIDSQGQEPKVYRSAQLSPKELKKQIEEKNIDVVLNLRGKSKAAWYQDEKGLLEDLDVEYHTYGFSVYRPPDRKRFLKILNLLDEVKAQNKTLMIHCRAGSDRTGLISTIIQIYLYGFSVEESKKNSLTWSYGHFPNSDGPLEQILGHYAPKQSEMSFKEWVLNEYDRQSILDHSEKRKRYFGFKL